MGRASLARGTRRTGMRPIAAHAEYTFFIGHLRGREIARRAPRGREGAAPPVLIPRVGGGAPAARAARGSRGAMLWIRGPRRAAISEPGRVWRSARPRVRFLAILARWALGRGLADPPGGHSRGRRCFVRRLPIPVPSRTARRLPRAATSPPPSSHTSGTSRPPGSSHRCRAVLFPGLAAGVRESRRARPAERWPMRCTAAVSVQRRPVSVSKPNPKKIGGSARLRFRRRRSGAGTEQMERPRPPARSRLRSFPN